MTKNIGKNIIAIISVLLFVFVVYSGYYIYQRQKSINELKQTYANINAINYGLFNMQEWKVKAFDVFHHHIEQFNISPKAFDEAEVELKKYLNSIYNNYIVSGELFKKVFEETPYQGPQRI